MNNKSTGSFIAIGCAVAIAASVIMGIRIGIGGGLLSACAGCIGVVLVATIANRVQTHEQLEAQPQVQLEGVLDSSQLDQTDDYSSMQQHRLTERKPVAVIVALAASIAVGGIVLATTHGVGINFYLGGTSANTSSSSSAKTTRPTMDSTQGDTTESSPATTSTHYDTEGSSASTAPASEATGASSSAEQQKKDTQKPDTQKQDTQKQEAQTTDNSNSATPTQTDATQQTQDQPQAEVTEVTEQPQQQQSAATDAQQTATE